MDFVTKSFRKDETLTSWTLSQHICPHFWAWLLLSSAITPKSEDKYVVKVFNWSEVHLSEMTLIQNSYFNKPFSFYLKVFCIFLMIFLANPQTSNRLVFQWFTPLIEMYNWSDSNTVSNFSSTKSFEWQFQHYKWWIVVSFQWQLSTRWVCRSFTYWKYNTSFT